ncbi:MAG: AI-2E family transporter [Bacteroidota bacterium]
MNITRVAAWLISIALGLALIIVGSEFFIPLFLALFLWYIINGINDSFRRLPQVDRYCPQWLSLTLSFSFIGLLLYFVGNLIVANVNEFILTAPNYMGKIDDLLLQVHNLLGRDGLPWTIDTIKYGDQLVANYSILLSGVTSIAKGFFLIILYVIFLLIEQGSFHRKIKAMGLTPSQQSRYDRVVSQVNSSMRKYLGVKTFTSALTAVLSYIVFYAIQLDYAVFWAFLIFLFNFVPTIGSITATILPGLLALLQFDGISQFLVIAIGVSGIQVLVGNIIEPRMMGDTLNISPLVIVLALIIWSILWGVAGMLLSVPITVMIIIFCAQFPATRNVAILLSKDGRIGKLEES